MANDDEEASPGFLYDALKHRENERMADHTHTHANVVKIVKAIADRIRWAGNDSAKLSKLSVDLTMKAQVIAALAVKPEAAIEQTISAVIDGV
jgi:hypothetical protein